MSKTDMALRGETVTAPELITSLWDQFHKLTSDETSASKAHGAANLAGKIVSIVKLTMEYRKLRGETPEIAFFG